MKIKINLLMVTMLLAASSAGFSQPIIVTQPQNQTNAVGTTATFSVWATNAGAPAYQWQKLSGSWTNLTDRTNTTLVLTNVQTSDDADYRVAITNLDGATNSAPAHLYVIAPPRITKVTNYNASVSLGAPVKMQVWATGTSLSYQWWFGSQALAGKTTALLNLTNVQTTNAGLYTVVVTNWADSVSTNVSLDVDPTFTKITTGPLVTDLASWRPAAWGDYNNDGYPDVYLHQRDPTADVLYRNNGDGTFTKVVEPTLQHTARAAMGGAWGDYDNDGHLDLFIANDTGVNVLLHNRGDGTFDWIRSGPGAEGVTSCAAVWGDYDEDGFLDLFVSNGGWDMAPEANWLYHNNGDGTFSKVTTNQVGSWLSEKRPWMLAGWVDYDQDGLLDLLVDPDDPPDGSGTRLNHNLGAGHFAPVTNPPPVFSFAWADYDNDGKLDLFTAFDEFTTNALYHNEGSGTFKKLSAAQVGSLVTDKGFAGGIGWGDYDNDGFLDLFIARGCWYQSGQGRQTSLLYHNNGDGTFTRVTTGSPANDVGQGWTANWVDYDHDGFLDLFVAEYGWDYSTSHRLYRNNGNFIGNSNNWLYVTCVGTASPRDGTGARVRALATIRGQPMWQLRLINCGGTSLGGQSFVAHFGLGDATNVDVLRIEWSSGTVQELHNVPVRQYLTVTEPARLRMAQAGQLQIQCWKGMSYGIQCSSNLSGWMPLATVTNVTGTLSWTDPDAPGSTARFYRAVKQ